jgi:hypothetical protein
MKINEIIQLNEIPRPDGLPKEISKKEADRNAFMSGLEQHATWMGPNSKTWDEKSYKLAMKMHKQGYNYKQIWALTGNIMGTDGHMRQEIDDSKAKLIKNAKGDTMGDHLIHDELFLAYPELRNQKFDPNWDNRNTSIAGQVYKNKISVGAYDSQNNRISDNEILKTSNHEWGHVIQNVHEPEFTGGGNPNSPTTIKVAKNNHITRMDAYRGISGEHTTNSSEVRHDLTKKQRRETPPDFSRATAHNNDRATRVTIPGTTVPNFNTKYPKDRNPIITKGAWGKKHVTFDNPYATDFYPDVTKADIDRIKQELKITTTQPKVAPAKNVPIKKPNLSKNVLGTVYGRDADGNRYDGKSD